MGYKKDADGVAKQGRTDAKVYPNDGPKVVQKGPHHGPQSLGKAMKAMGRNMARIANQRGR